MWKTYREKKYLLSAFSFFPILPSKGSPCLLPNPELIGKALRTPPLNYVKVMCDNCRFVSTEQQAEFLFHFAVYELFVDTSNNEIVENIGRIERLVCKCSPN